ncbi:PD-(D/E)XK nuclease family protein [Nocardioides ultimimeridianus]
MTTSEPEAATEWQAAFDELTAEADALRADGLWRTGRRTLLGALGLHHDEVVMCRGLAWLLTPDGWHGLGTGVLDRLLAAVGADSAGSTRAVIAVEEPRDDTRADIVVRLGATTVLIEAKIWAGEQARQCDRLARHWADEAPTLVFLTRTGSQPLTAIESAGQWHALAWNDIADFIEASADGRDDIDVGVHEYLRTVRVYGGNRE